MHASVCAHMRSMTPTPLLDLQGLESIGGEFIAKGNGALMDLYPMTALTKVRASTGTAV